MSAHVGKITAKLTDDLRMSARSQPSSRTTCACSVVIANVWASGPPQGGMSVSMVQPQAEPRRQAPRSESEGHCGRCEHDCTRSSASPQL